MDATKEETKEEDALGHLLSDAEKHLKEENPVKRICVECYEEGYDQYCADCGGKMIKMDDDEDDLLTLDDETSALTSSNPSSALARLEALMNDDTASSQTAATTTTAKSVPTKEAVSSVIRYDGEMSLSVFRNPLMSFVLTEKDAAYDGKVFILDLGTEYTKVSKAFATSLVCVTLC